MSIAAQPAEGRYIRTPIAAERLGISSPQLNKLIRSGALTVRQLPGLRAMVLEADVDRLLLQSTKPATK
jgi:predicted site-specific integrase-resolvase